MTMSTVRLTQQLSITETTCPPMESRAGAQLRIDAMAIYGIVTYASWISPDSTCEKVAQG